MDNNQVVKYLNQALSIYKSYLDGNLEDKEFVRRGICYCLKRLSIGNILFNNDDYQWFYGIEFRNILVSITEDMNIEWISYSYIYPPGEVKERIGLLEKLIIYFNK